MKNIKLLFLFTISIFLFGCNSGGGSTSSSGGASTNTQIQFCVDSGCSIPVTSINLYTQPNDKTSEIVYVKNIGSDNTGTINSNFNPSVSGLSSQSNTCSAGIAPGGVCSFLLTYDPNATVSGSTAYSLIFGSTESSITVNYVSSSSSESGLMVGYLSNSYGIGHSVYTEISQAAAAGYNTVVIAFAVVNGEDPVQFYGNQFLAYTNYETFATCPAAVNAMKSDIDKAKANGLKYVLASVGGANNTFNISSTDDLDVVAQRMVDFLNEFGLDGFDFDIEFTQTGLATQLDTLIQALKSKKAGIIISAAPQANSIDNTDPTQVSLVSTGTSQIYSQAIENHGFDYIWLQAYNTGPATNQINGTNELDAEYIQEAYPYFVESQTYVNIPASTKFIIGEPVTTSAGGDATVWHNPAYANADAVYTALAASYSVLSQNNQLHGAMGWSINQDIDEGCQFSSHIASIAAGISSITCPTNGGTYHGGVCPQNFN